jgi:hypothetical protein
MMPGNSPFCSHSPDCFDKPIMEIPSTSPIGKPVLVDHPGGTDSDSDPPWLGSIQVTVTD